MNTFSETISINNKSIHYTLINTQYRNAEKPVLVFLHEGLGSTAQWRDFPELLSNLTKCCALIYDRYGYGQSDAFSGNRSNTFMLDEARIFLPKLLDYINITELILPIGHSDGGTIALLYAATFPEKIKALITEADHVICEEITVEGIENIVSEYQKGPLKKLLEKFHGDKTDTMFYSWSNCWLKLAEKKWNILDYLTHICCPVLAIQGKNDCYGSVKQLTLKLEHIKAHTEVFYIAGCGHVPHFETKDMVLSKMKSFINSF